MRRGTFKGQMRTGIRRRTDLAPQPLIVKPKRYLKDRNIQFYCYSFHRTPEQKGSILIYRVNRIFTPDYTQEFHPSFSLIAHYNADFLKADFIDWKKEKDNLLQEEIAWRSRSFAVLNTLLMKLDKLSSLSELDEETLTVIANFFGSSVQWEHVTLEGLIKKLYEKDFLSLDVESFIDDLERILIKNKENRFLRVELISLTNDRDLAEELDKKSIYDVKCFNEKTELFKSKSLKHLQWLRNYTEEFTERRPLIELTCPAVESAKEELNEKKIVRNRQRLELQQEKIFLLRKQQELGIELDSPKTSKTRKEAIPKEQIKVNELLDDNTNKENRLLKEESKDLEEEQKIVIPSLEKQLAESDPYNKSDVRNLLMMAYFIREDLFYV